MSPDPDLDRLLLPEEGDIEIPESLQMKIVSRLWDYQFSPLAGSEFLPQRYVAYFKYFRSECRNWKASASTVVIVTYRDFLDLVDHLKRNSKERRASAKMMAFFPPIHAQISGQAISPTQFNIPQPLASRYQSCIEESIHNAIYLTVRLWLMVNVGPPNPTIFTGRSNVKWAQTDSLEDVIAATFPLIPPLKEQRGQHWPKSLNAYNLDRIGGFDVIWTSNLADHLQFDDDLERINLYHHACVLEGYQNTSVASHILPDDLVNETLLTLALILPRANKNCQKWFQKVQKSQQSLSGALDPVAADQKLIAQGRSLDTYKYWNDRLMMIAEAFRNSEPRGVSHWWLDRRKRVQWYTFWLAIIILLLTVIFGLIQSVTSILQVYIAYHPPS